MGWRNPPPPPVPFKNKQTNTWCNCLSTPRSRIKYVSNRGPSLFWTIYPKWHDTYIFYIDRPVIGHNGRQSVRPGILWSVGSKNTQLLHVPISFQETWWRLQMETFSVLLALCAGNSPVTGEFPAQSTVTRSFDVFFDLCLNKRLR